MKHSLKILRVFIGLIVLLTLPAVSHAPIQSPYFEYINDYQAYMFEKVGVDENNGRMVKHRDDSGNVRTISWDKKDD